MNGTIETEIEGIVSKNFIRKEVKRYVELNRHGLQDRITNKVIEKCMCFIAGWLKCFKHFGTQPINENELKSLLVQECIEWTINYLDEEF